MVTWHGGGGQVTWFDVQRHRVVVVAVARQQRERLRVLPHPLITVINIRQSTHDDVIGVITFDRGRSVDVDVGHVAR